MTTRAPDDDYHNEIEMAGLYGGGVMGGLVLGSFGDLINSELNSLAWYITGAVLGAIVGAIAGRLFRTVALAPTAADEDEPHTQRLRRAAH
jgi:hypothetical protein